MKLFTYLRKMLSSPAIFLEVLGAGVTEELSRTRAFVRTEACNLNLLFKVAMRAQGTRPIRKAGTLGILSRERETEEGHSTCQGTRSHPLES
jgi:hypothetical protein